MTESGTQALSSERPFPGLRPFAFADHGFFFGRKAQFYALYRLLDLNRFVAVVGSSGSGKSSLVSAGLLPLLQQENDESGARKWLWAELRPGDAPIEQLGNALTRLAQTVSNDEDPLAAVTRAERIRHHLRGSSFGLESALNEIGGIDGMSLALVVDQFEELFRFVINASHGLDPRQEARTRDEATRFVQLLLAASRSKSYDLRIIITMRSDFIGDCARFQGLPEAVSAAQFLVPSLTRDQREQVIRGPIREAKATIDSALVERILIESSEEFDQLPVMAHCLRRLWDRAGADQAPDAASNGRTITLEHYKEIGGVSSALSQHADEILRDLPGLKPVVERTFRALSELDREGRATRRARLFEQLIAETGVAEGDLRKVLDRFRADDCSFLTPSRSAVPVLAAQHRIDVGHEALLRRWEEVSGEPGATGETNDSRRLGWLQEEARDGRRYQALLSLVDSETTSTLPLDQVERHWVWWTNPPRTEAWADRYGGGHARIQRLMTDSRTALEADKRRKEADAEREREHLARERRAYRRTRIAFGVSIVLFVIMAVVGFMAQRSAEEARRHAAEAERNRDIGINQTRNLAISVSDALSQGAVSTTAAQEMLTIAQAAVDALASLSTEDQTPKVQAVLAQLYISTSDVHATLGDRKQALTRAEKAKALANKLVGDENEQIRYGAMVRIGDIELKYGHLDASVTNYDEALGIAQRLSNGNSEDGKRLCDWVWVNVKVAEAYRLQKKFDAAIESLNKVAKSADECAKKGTARMDWRIAPAIVHTHLGLVLAEQPGASDDATLTKRRTEVLVQLNNAIGLHKDFTGDFTKYSLAQSHLAKANVLASLGKFGNPNEPRDFNFAHPNYQRAIGLLRDLFEKDSGNINWLIALVAAYRQHVLELQKANHLQIAFDQLFEETEFRTTLVAKNDDNADWKKELAERQALQAELKGKNPLLKMPSRAEDQNNRPADKPPVLPAGETVQ